MSRATPADVQEILETQLPDEVLQAFLTDASRVVDERCAGHTSDTRALASVETYLAAHFATAKEPRVTTASHDGFDLEYEGESHRYWNRAVLLDPTGRLVRPNGFAYTTHS